MYYTNNLTDRHMKRYILIIFTALLIFGCSSEPDSFDDLKSEGIKAFSKGDYQTAKKYLLKATLLKSSDRDVLFFLGVSLKRDFQYDSAMIFLKRADLLFPDNKELNQEIYEIAKQTNDHKNALSAIKVFIKNGAPRSEYLPEMADLNLQIGNKYLALLELREVIEDNSDKPTVYLAAANVAAQIDSVDAAIYIMELSIEKFGDLEELLSNYAIYLAGADRVADAEAVLRKQLSISEAPQAVKLNLANILTMYDSKNKKREAYKLYKEIYSQVGDVLKLDSTIKALEKELNISK